MYCTCIRSGSRNVFRPARQRRPLINDCQDFPFFYLFLCPFLFLPHCCSRCWDGQYSNFVPFLVAFIGCVSLLLYHIAGIARLNKLDNPGLVKFCVGHFWLVNKLILRNCSIQEVLIAFFKPFFIKNEFLYHLLEVERF